MTSWPFLWFWQCTLSLAAKCTYTYHNYWHERILSAYIHKLDSQNGILQNAKYTPTKHQHTHTHVYVQPGTGLRKSGNGNMRRGAVNRTWSTPSTRTRHGLYINTSNRYRLASPVDTPCRWVRIGNWGKINEKYGLTFFVVAAKTAFIQVSNKFIVFPQTQPRLTAPVLQLRGRQRRRRHRPTN